MEDEVNSPHNTKYFKDTEFEEKIRFCFHFLSPFFLALELLNMLKSRLHQLFL